MSIGGGPILAIVNTKDTAAVSGYLKRPEIRSMLPGDKRFAKFVWGKPTSVTDEKLKRNRNG